MNQTLRVNSRISHCSIWTASRKRRPSAKGNCLARSCHQKMHKGRVGRLLDRPCPCQRLPKAAAALVWEPRCWARSKRRLIARVYAGGRRPTIVSTGGALRTSEALRLGMSPGTLYGLRDSGVLEPLGRGPYHLSILPPLSWLGLRPQRTAWSLSTM